MSDISNNQKNTVGIENITSGNDLVVNSDGSINIVHDDRLGVDADKLFGFSIEQNQASTGEQNLILFRNPSGSGKTVYIRKINIGAVDSLTRFRIRVYQKPTVTSTGSAGTIFSYRVKTSPASTAMNVYTVPTTSAKGTKIRTYSQADTGSKWEDFEYSIAVIAGQDLLITGDTDATNKILSVDLQWSEE